MLRRGRATPRVAAAAVVLATALLATALLAAGVSGTASAKPSATAATVSQPFAADSGDRFKCGSTNGQFGWHPGSPQTVDVQGTVADHPLPGEPRNGACGDSWYPDDGYFTDVTFTAYAGASQVGSVSASADNGERTFPSGFALNASGPIERVTVQVCRLSHGPPALPPVPVRYCGPAQTYQSPLATGS